MNKKVLLLVVIACVLSAIAYIVSAGTGGGPAGEINNATNPNGSTYFTTDLIVQIQTMSPNIDVLNFQLRWQNFSGTFDTTKGECTGCTFDKINTCQAEVEKIWGMFQTYNLTINLTPANNITMQALEICCRDLNDTITVGLNANTPTNCSNLTNYTASTYSTNGCFTPTSVSPYSYNYTNTYGGKTVCIDMHNLTKAGLEIPIGIMTPTYGPNGLATCEMIACEINGTWNMSNDQSFTINKTITVRALS